MIDLFFCVKVKNLAGYLLSVVGDLGGHWRGRQQWHRISIWSNVPRMLIAD